MRQSKYRKSNPRPSARTFADGFFLYSGKIFQNFPRLCCGPDGHRNRQAAYGVWRCRNADEYANHRCINDVGARAIGDPDQRV